MESMPNATRIVHTQFGAPIRFLYLIAVLVISLMVGFAGISLWQSRENHEDRVETDLENLSRVLEQYIHGALHEIDLTLRIAADEFNRQMRMGSVREDHLTSFLKEHQGRLPQVISLRIADATGTVRYGEGVNLSKPINIADREYDRNMHIYCVVKRLTDDHVYVQFLEDCPASVMENIILTHIGNKKIRV